MDFDIKKQPKSIIKFQIKATSEEVAKFFDRAIEILAKDLKMPGFRPGKMPKEMAEESIGKQAIENQARESAINDSYFQMVTQNKLIPLDRPGNVKINKFSKEEGLDWEGEIGILPEVELGDWKKELKVKSEKLKIKEVKIEKGEIEDAILTLRKQLAKLEEKNEVSASGDWVNIDIDISDKDKERFTAEKIKKFQSKGFGMVIGEAKFIPGFEENLIGLEKGSEKEFEATFPKEYVDKDIAEKKINFKIKINEIKKVVLPEENEEFTKKFGKNNVDELKKAIEEDIKKHKENQERARFEDEVLREIITTSKFDIPDVLVEQEKDMITERFKHDLEHHKGVNFADYMASLGKGEKEIKDGFSEQAINNVKMGLVLGQITKNEGIIVNDKDVEEMMSMDIVRQTTGLPPEKTKEVEGKIKERYTDEQFVSSIKNSILARKTIDLIVGVMENKNN